jgi:hypothetical protein
LAMTIGAVAPMMPPSTPNNARTCTTVVRS